MKIKIIAPIILIVVFIGILIQIMYRSGFFIDQKQECLKMFAKNVVLQIDYTNEFISNSDDSIIRISKKTDSKRRLSDNNEESSEFLTIILNPNEYESSQALIDDYLIENGAVFTKTTINGYDAVVGSSTEAGYSYYIFPISGISFYVSYNPSILTDNQKTLANKILESITFHEINKSVQEPRVERCN